MKLQQTNPISLVKKTNHKISFGGYKDDYNTRGQEGYKFFYTRSFDKSKYDLSFEYVGLIKDGENWIVDPDYAEFGAEAEEMEDGKPLFISKEFPLIKESDNRNKKDGTKPDRAFGYRFKLTEKNNESARPIYINDPGVLSQEDSERTKFNVLLLSTGGIHKKGPMYHILPDSYYNKNWGEKPQDALEVRNHFNVAGGNIEGMIDKLNSGDLDAYELIISTPLFGKDEISSHGYWTSNPYQISNMKGDLNLFKQFNTELFKKGKQYVADGAFTSQGFDSPFLKHALKWGKQSPYYNWFKFDFAGNDSNPQIQLGVLPESDKAFRNTSYKLVNAPGQPNYNSNKPTFIQFYDKRLVTGKQAEDTKELIKTYDKKLADSYDVSNHQDSVLPYSFEIRASDARKIRALVDNVGNSLPNIENYEELLSFDNFKVTRKRRSSGANFWDGQLDLVKMNLSNPSITNENKVGNVQAKNHLFNVASYWTRTTNNALLEEFASKSKDEQKAIATANGVSEKRFDAISTAIAGGEYQVNLFKDNFGKNEFILSEILDFPLESIEVNPNLTAVLGSPLITPNAVAPHQSNMKKVDLLQGNTVVTKEMRDVYNKTIPAFVTSVLQKMDAGATDGKKIFVGDKLSEYGKFITRIITPELVKYAIVKGMFGESDIVFKENEVSYNTGTLSKKGIYELGIAAAERPIDEAKKLGEKLLANTLNLATDADKLAKIYNKKFEKADANSFKLAQAIIEKSGAGLNWRFDAAKDVADLSKVRSNPDLYTFEDAMDDMINFWTPFVSNIKNENANSMSIAELTTLGEFYESGNRPAVEGRQSNAKKFGKYLDFEVAEKIFYEKTGSTTGSNYSQFFGILPEIYGQNIEHGGDNPSGHVTVTWLHDKIKKEFLAQNQLAFITNNHIFVDNHDKPRALHGLALDMKFFLSEFNNEESINTGREVMGNDIDLGRVSSKGVAVAKVYKEHFRKFAQEFNLDINKVDRAIIELAAGKIDSESDYNEARSRAFGARPLELTIKDVIERAKTGLTETDEAKLEQKVLESIMEAPLNKFENMWELMISLGGIPTMFNGEEYGQTGHETSSKNQELGCRNIVLHNRKNDGSMFSKFYQRINAASGLHSIKDSSGKKPLSALSGGIPTMLDQRDNGTLAIHKYDDKGSEVISVLADVGLDRSNPQRLIGKITPIDAVLLGEVKTEGTFRRKVWNGEKYIDDGINYTAKDGTLRDSMGSPIQLKEGANVFYKVASSEVSFTGNPHVKLHNTKYAIPV